MGSSLGPRRGSSGSWAFTAAGGCVVGAYLLLDADPGLQAWLFVAWSASAVVALGAGVVRRSRDLRTPWVVLLASQVVYLVAVAGWYLIPVVGGRVLPYPSALDVAFWVAYLGWAVFLVALGRATGTLDRIASLDTVISVIAVGSVAYVLMHDSLMAPRISTNARVATLIYVGLLIGLISLAVRQLTHVTSSASLRLVVCWIGVELLADVWYTLASARGTFEFGDPAFVLWLLSYTALGALALHPKSTLLARSQAPSRASRSLVLTGCVAAPLLLAVEEALEGRSGSAYTFAGLTLLAVWFVLLRLRAVSLDRDREARLRADLARSNAELERVVARDDLTGLYNRRSFTELVAAAIASRSDAALLLLDLDGFKAVNDVYGHRAGDQVLRRTAQRIAEVVDGSGDVARLGADEFAVLLHPRAAEAVGTARRLVRRVAEPIGPELEALRTVASVGVHWLSEDSDVQEALTKADVALLGAKQAGGGVHVYDASVHTLFGERYRLETQLRSAVANAELVVFYQPVIDLRTRAAVGAEALVRWQHPDGQLRGPAAFMDLAEESGLIVEIGRWVLERACADAARWRAEVPQATDIGVAVNVSRRQLDLSDFGDQVVDVLNLTRLDPAALTLEVTETALARRSGTSVGTLEKLRHLGVAVAMDDFGTGYSSLAELRTLPLDVLKIDKAFVDGIAREEQEWTLAVAILKLAASLGKGTVAEGIETASQLAHLKTLGADHGQGYLFARPMPLDLFLDWVRERERSQAARAPESGA